MNRQKLVLVSNRIPVTFASENGKLKGIPSSGGLVSALEPLLKDHGGVWVGSGGTEDSREIRKILEKSSGDHPFRYEPLFLTEEEQSNFYEGFSNEIVWPLFHDLQSRCNFDPRYWEFYEKVNSKFAAAVEKASKSEDLIWIHDYQLMQVGKIIRRNRPKVRLAFFLHIPFPSPDIFAKLPWRQQILDDLMAHDLVGLQTGRDQRNLIACLRGFLPSVKISGRGEGRTVISGYGHTHVEAFPISIDYRAFSDLSASIPVVERAKQIKAKVREIQIAVGVDRLDYTKGIPERIKAYGSFLRTYPQFRGKVVLIQIVVPSREGIPRYDQLKREVERLVTQVNGEFSEPGWVPINFIYRSVPREELVAIYRAADVALITCLKDGMNLVAKEYCAAKTEANGVLVLSEFAGAAPELRVGAILVNPNDEVGVAATLKQALEMTPEERRRRMLRLRQQIRQADILTWRDRFFDALEKTGTVSAKTT
ncbi:MAG TPA: trehalose-6-phosphate synthase [Acidobacteriaceae bacterium]|nr:trehalose-6-phosphate synthase [Acidobacteriaceae bacterium]